MVQITISLLWRNKCLILKETCIKLCLFCLETLEDATLWLKELIFQWKKSQLSSQMHLLWHIWLDHTSIWQQYDEIAVLQLLKLQNIDRIWFHICKNLKIDSAQIVKTNGLAMQICFHIWSIMKTWEYMIIYNCWETLYVYKTSSTR